MWLVEIIQQNVWMFETSAWLSESEPSDFQCMIWQNYVVVKDPLKVWDRPMDFNVTGYENFIVMIPDFTVQLTFKKISIKF